MREQTDLADNLPTARDATPFTPGIYRGISNAAYHADAAQGQSRLKQILRSPAHYRDYVSTGSKSKGIGSCCHAAVLLGRTEFAAEFAEMPDVDGRTSAGKAAKAAAIAAANGKEFLDIGDYQTALRCADSVMDSKTAKALVDVPRDSREVTLVWRDADTGIMCKARPDVLTGNIIDVKGCRDARSHAFERSIHAYGYHHQAAWYLHGAKECGLDVAEFQFVCVETAPPFAVACYHLDPQALEQGGHDMRRALDLLAECRASGTWPGYADGIVPIGLPSWAMDDETEIDFTE